MRFVGGTDPLRKGILDIVRAAPQVIAQVPRARFWFTGGENAAQIEPECRRVGIADHVEFMGWVDEADMPGIYASADILLLPSYNEGLPYVVIEAMAAGLPVISTPVGAIPEVVEDGVNGYLIDPGDVAALADRMLRLAGDPAARPQIAKCNRHKAMQAYSLEASSTALGSIFSALVSHSVESNH